MTDNKTKPYKTQVSSSGGIIYDFSESYAKNGNPRTTLTDSDTGEVFYLEERTDSATLS